MRWITGLAVTATLAGAAFAEQPPNSTKPDLAKYDCTRTDDGKTVSGDLLAANGFIIVSRARFGDVNLMLANPKSSVRANCFARSR